MTIESILRRISDICRDALGGNLTGVYVHGSIAFGCFRWETSDVDFIVVTKETPTLAEKIRLMEQLLALDALCPPKGMEMSVVTEECCRHFTHPAPYALHFSHAYLQRAQTDLAAYCRDMHGEDRDLAAHFTVIREKGVCLCGEAIASLFGEVPRSMYLDSLLCDVENAEAEIEENAVYLTLNLCRVLAYVREGAVLSKAEGGKWAMAQPYMPLPYKVLIQKALKDYCEGERMHEMPEGFLRKFAGNMLLMIRRLSGMQ